MPMESSRKVATLRLRKSFVKRTDPTCQKRTCKTKKSVFPLRSTYWLSLIAPAYTASPCHESLCLNTLFGAIISAMTPPQRRLLREPLSCDPSMPQPSTSCEVYYLKWFLEAFGSRLDFSHVLSEPAARVQVDQCS
eukprot:319321-Amphidinium_carterae.1